MNSLKGVQSIFDYVAFETKNKQGLATHGSIGLLEFLHMTCELVISRTLKKLHHGFEHLGSIDNSTNVLSF
jgi:hypothetical protein